MRVVAGEHRGRRLRAPAGRATRPTADRVREALFSMLGTLEGLSVLDLFAGSGALGIEAASRGAESVAFVDSDPRAVAAIRQNLADVGLDAPVTRGDALDYLRGRHGRFDLIFVDPPYSCVPRLAAPLAERLPAAMTGAARIVTESDRRHPLELPMPLVRERRYGDTRIAIHRVPDGGTAVCPGTYDPVTLGHLDIIERTAAVFARVVVAVVNQPPRKQKTLFSAEERCGFIEAEVEKLGNVQVKSFDRLVVEFAREQSAKAIVKGLRAISDFEYEFEMNQLNRKMAPDIESIYLISSPMYSFLSSSGVKEVAMFGGDLSELVPSSVAGRLEEAARR